MYYLNTVFLFLLCLSTCGKAIQKEAPNWVIDEQIAKEVETKISPSNFGNFPGGKLLIYENAVIADYYEDDVLGWSTRDTMAQMTFRSFFYARQDTMVIDGAFGLFGGFGFSIKIVGDQATVYHLLAGDDFPTFAMTQEAPLQLRLEVPCTNTKLILSKKPERKAGDIIYGVVEFESDSYYRSPGSIDGKEMKRKKSQMNMKVYFKSKFLDTP